MGLERLQLIAPKGLDLVEPLAQWPKRLRLQPIEAHTGVVLRLLVSDQTAAAQHTQVATQQRRRGVQRRREFSGALRSLLEQANDGTAG